MQARGAVKQQAEHDRNIGLRMMVTEDDGNRYSLSGGAGRWSSGLSMTGLFSNFNYNYNDDWDAITPSTLWCPRRPGRGGGGGFLRTITPRMRMTPRMRIPRSINLGAIRP